ncbi:hypothetical protein LuPra_02923 [Luteitalea pratensis]|uniref:Lipoprotein n=1 Tax=Luteitalea pratensis TaxID=1855912 RepID=A0A143PPF9_LUTPR|nr:hypothetical protein [Luteitalea pratensis]AMY09699.1 hypothetical protein LuPra_02923 [Luteitalea pratensis]
MNVRGWSVIWAPMALVLACGLSGCSSSAPAAEVSAAAAVNGPAAPKALEDATATVFEDEEAHADRPPHGGVVVALGPHAAHAEVVAVPDNGELSLYVLDAEGQPGQRIAQPKVVVDVETSGRLVRLEMVAAPDEGLGERVGDASHFVVKSDELLRMAAAKVTVKWLGVNGQVYSDVVVDWAAAAP